MILVTMARSISSSSRKEVITDVVTTTLQKTTSRLILAHSNESPSPISTGLVESVKLATNDKIVDGVWFESIPKEKYLPFWYNGYTLWVRFHFDRRKSERLRGNLKRGIGFEEVLELFSRPYYQDNRSDLPEQHRAIGWVGERLYSVIFEVREDEEGEFYHLVTLWKATREERTLYEENS